MTALRVFLAFVREGCAFAKKSNHPAWSDRELDQRCRDFLLSIVIDAWEDKAKDLGIRRIFSSPTIGAIPSMTTPNGKSKTRSNGSSIRSCCLTRTKLSPLVPRIAVNRNLNKPTARRLGRTTR